MPGDGLAHGPPAKQKAGGSHHRFSRIIRHSLRDGFNAYIVLLCPQNLPECANGRFSPTARLGSPGKLLGQGTKEGTKDEAQDSPAELARDIARTISASTPARTGAAISFESAVSDENVVEIRYSVADPAVFARLKGNADMMRSAKVSYFCSESRVAYLKRGVVIREIVALRDGSDKIEFVVDRAACDSLVVPALADAKTLAQIAQSVAKAENEQKSGANDLFRFDSATSHEGNVDKRLIVINATLLRTNFARITAVATGYDCAKYRLQMFQGSPSAISSCWTTAVPLAIS